LQRLDRLGAVVVLKWGGGARGAAERAAAHRHGCIARGLAAGPSAEVPDGLSGRDCCLLAALGGAEAIGEGGDQGGQRGPVLEDLAASGDGVITAANRAPGQ
jgi:hypothetical protein